MKDKKKNRPAAEKPERKATKPAEKKEMLEEEHIRNTEPRYGESQGGVSDGLKGGSRF